MLSKSCARGSGKAVRGMSSRDRQFSNFAHILHMECTNIYQEALLNGCIDADQRVIAHIARREYDFAKHVVSETIGTSDVTHVADLTELPKDQDMYLVDNGDCCGAQALEVLKPPKEQEWTSIEGKMPDPKEWECDLSLDTNILPADRKSVV